MRPTSPRSYGGRFLTRDLLETAKFSIAAYVFWPFSVFQAGEKLGYGEGLANRHLLGSIFRA